MPTIRLRILETNGRCFYKCKTGDYSAKYKTVQGVVKRYYCKDFGCPMKMVKSGVEFEAEIRKEGSTTLTHMAPIDFRSPHYNELSSTQLQDLYKEFESMPRVLNLMLAESWKVSRAHKPVNVVRILRAWVKKEYRESLVSFLQTNPFRVVYGRFYESYNKGNYLCTWDNKTRGFLRALAFAAAQTRDLPEEHKRNFEMIEGYVQEFDKNKVVYSPASNTKKYPTPLVLKRLNEGTYVALARFVEMEEFIVNAITALLHKPLEEDPRIVKEALDREPNLRLDDIQRDAVVRACTENVFALVGYAGTGKSSTAAMIVKIINNILHKDIVCVSPTGKASRRSQEVLKEKDLDGIEVCTLHALYWNNHLKGEKRYGRVLLVDEAGMVDMQILADLLTSESFCKIIFVGDTGQLYPVGPGQVFIDIWRSVPHSELTKIYRTKGGSLIAENGQAIRRGWMPKIQSEVFDVTAMPGNWMQTEWVSKIAQTTADLYRRKGETTVGLVLANAEARKLNTAIREILNPPAKEIKAEFMKGPSNCTCGKRGICHTCPQWVFREGDRVINTKNLYTPQEYVDPLEPRKLLVANGDVGIIQNIIKYAEDLITITVQFDAGHTHQYVCNSVVNEAKEQLRPAYFLTVHKSQGSEYDNCVKVVAHYNCKRRWLYTGVTRAKKRVVIFSTKDRLQRACQTPEDPRLSDIKIIQHY